MSVRILIGDCRDTLRELPDGCVQTVVTSPPYFGLRDYGTGEWEGGDPACEHKGAPRQSTASTLMGNGHGPDRLSPSLQAQTAPVRECPCGARRVDRQIGLEPSPDEFVAALVGVFREVRRVLRDDGTVWINLGDSYAATSTYNAPRSMHSTNGWKQAGRGPNPSAGEAKPKDLLGIPWMVAFALRADGWYLRLDIIWSKPNPMPESVTDRPTKAHEYVFLLSKGPRYFYDADAIRERAGQPEGIARLTGQHKVLAESIGTNGDGASTLGTNQGAANRNKRSVWTVATQPYPGAHFATFPPKLIEPCILAGSSPKACGVCGAPWQRVVERTAMVVKEGPKRQAFRDFNPGRSRTQVGGTMTEAPSSRTVGWEPSCGHQDDSGQSVVLDPFAGSGTTGAVALEHGRAFIGCELNPAYGELIRDRLLSAPLALEGFGAA